MWGCEKDGTQPIQIDGEEHKRCPRRPLLEEPSVWNGMLSPFSAYRQHNVLPEDGGWGSQPAKLMLCFEEMANALAETAKAKEESEKARRGHEAVAPGRVSQPAPGPGIRSVQPKVRPVGKKK